MRNDLHRFALNYAVQIIFGGLYLCRHIYQLKVYLTWHLSILFLKNKNETVFNTSQCHVDFEKCNCLFLSLNAEVNI